ncbi:MAG: hypothetical protein WAK21_00130, partial [Candidatus Sulfotelmatobacter sp.]
MGTKSVSCGTATGNATAKLTVWHRYPQASFRDHEGTVWANTWTGVIRFDGTRWEHIGKDWNFPENVPSQTSTVLFVDRIGTLWAGVNSTILYLK